MTASTPGHAQIYEVIRSELVSFTRGTVEIGEETDLVTDLNLDSLQIMNLLLAIEDRFDVSIPINALADVRTVRDFVAKLNSLLER